MKLFNTLSFFVLLPLFLQSPLVAQTTEVMVLEEEEETKSFQVSGYVDVYFQNVFSSDAEDNALSFPTSFTPETRGFSVGNINLLAEKSLGKVGFVGQVGFGPRAVDANVGTDAGEAGYYIPNLQQLYVTYAPSEAVTLTLGQFGTFVGYEVIDASANMNYSTSYMFSYGPFFHTGLKADFAIGEGFGAMLAILNNTDSRFNQPGGFYYGGQLSGEVGGLAAYLNLLYGTDVKDFSGENDLNTLQLDLTATFEASESLMFGINATDKTQGLDGNTASGFTGLALYSTIGLSETFDLSLRGEYFSEKTPEGLTLDGRSVTALTATGNINIGDLRIMPEFRFDLSSDFDTTYGDIIDFGGGGIGDDNIASFILAAVYSF